MERFRPFKPHLLLGGGHRQTLAALLWAAREPNLPAREHRVELDDGDQCVLHDDKPSCWQAGGPIALLIHGLAGSHASSYMVRIARKLRERGLRTFRMDLRTCGAGCGLARLPYHSGRSEDAAAALRCMAQLCPGSPATLIGFSLGGNIALKLAGECGADVPGALARVVAVCPPIDLEDCVRSLRRSINRFYDGYFARKLCKQIAMNRRLRADIPEGEWRRTPRTLFEFDDLFTAPVCGFGRAENYYARCSSGQFIPHIGVPTLIVAAIDDPLIPFRGFERLSMPPHVQLVATPHGGHMGFIGRRNGDPDRRWIDWRIAEWAAAPCE